MVKLASGKEAHCEDGLSAEENEMPPNKHGGGTSPTRSCRSSMVDSRILLPRRRTTSKRSEPSASTRTTSPRPAKDRELRAGLSQIRSSPECARAKSRSEEAAGTVTTTMVEGERFLGRL